MVKISYFPTDNNPFDDLFKYFLGTMVHSLKSVYHKTDSWFDFNATHFQQLDPVNRPPKTSNVLWDRYLDDKPQIIKRIILPTKTQQRIIFNWFEGHRLMYNETVKFINKNKYFDGPNKGEYILDSKKQEIKNRVRRRRIL